MTTPGTTEPDLDAVFGALSNPTRRGLLLRLSAADATISELAEPLAMTLPAVSKHLRVLERAGLVSRTREGKAQRCRVHAEMLAKAENWLAERRTFWEGNLDSLASHFEHDDATDSTTDSAADSAADSTADQTTDSTADQTTDSAADQGGKDS